MLKFSKKHKKGLTARDRNGILLVLSTRELIEGKRKIKKSRKK